MPTMHCTEPVCLHEWSERDAPPSRPRCPRCGGFWVRVELCAPREATIREAPPLAAMRSMAPLSFR